MEEVSKESPKVDIIVCTVNLLNYTKLAFETLYNNTKIPFHLIIVDICSQDGSQEWFKEFSKEKKNVTVVLKGKKDKGFAEGFNTGLDYCKTPYVASYHSDMLVTKTGWIKHLLELMERNPKIAYVGSKLLYPNDTLQHVGASFNKNTFQWYHFGRGENKSKFSGTFETPGVTGAGSLIRRSAIPNGLPTFYERAEYSDVEVSCQLRKDGWKIFYCGKSVLYHSESLGKKKYWDWNKLQKRYGNHIRTFRNKWEKWLREDMKKNPHLYNY